MLASRVTIRLRDSRLGNRKSRRWVRLVQIAVAVLPTAGVVRLAMGRRTLVVVVAPEAWMMWLSHGCTFDGKGDGSTAESRARS